MPLPPFVLSRLQNTLPKRMDTIVRKSTYAVTFRASRPGGPDEPDTVFADLPTYGVATFISPTIATTAYHCYLSAVRQLYPPAGMPGNETSSSWPDITVSITSRADGESSSDDVEPTTMTFDMLSRGPVAILRLRDPASAPHDRKFLQLATPSQLEEAKQQDVFLAGMSVWQEVYDDFQDSPLQLSVQEARNLSLSSHGDFLFYSAAPSPGDSGCGLLLQCTTGLVLGMHLLTINQLRALNASSHVEHDDHNDAFALVPRAQQLVEAAMSNLASNGGPQTRSLALPAWKIKDLAIGVIGDTHDIPS